MAKDVYQKHPWSLIAGLSVRQYEDALRALDRAGEIADKQWLMLSIHWQAPDNTLSAVS
jgi:hypothetical protein